MSGIKISEIKQIPDSDVTNVDSFLVLDKETGKTKRLTVQQFTLFTLATLFSSQQGGAFSDKGVLYINETDFRTDPQQRFVWDYDTGRLGIGTATPEATLDVRGSILLNGYRFSESSTNPRALTIAANSVQNAGAGTIAIGDSIMIGADSNAVGNIGIGAYALQNNITGDYNIGIGYNAGKNITGTGNVIIGSYQGTAGDNNIVLSNGQDGVARLLIDSAGNVGIGTTSPGATLHIDRDATAGETAILAKGGDNNFKLYVYQTYLNSDSDTLAEIGLRYTGTDRNASIRFHRGPAATGGFLSFTTNDNTEKMRIDSAGNVGIGTTSPGTKLEVNGNIKFTSNGQGIDFGASAGGGSTSNLLDDYEEGTWQPHWNFAGDVVYATTGSPFGSARYLKVGRLVYLSISISAQQTTNSSTGGTFRIRNLPFPPVQNNVATPIDINLPLLAGIVNTDSLIYAGGGGVPYIEARGQTAGSQNRISQIFTWNNGDFVNIQASITYYTTA